MENIDRKKAKALGFSDEEIGLIEEKREAKAFEGAKSDLENSDELKALKVKVKSFGHPVRIVVEITKNTEGILAKEPTTKLSYPTKAKSTTSTNGNGNGAKKACTVNGVGYDSCKSACTALDFDTKDDSAKRVLDRMLKAGKIESFELTE